MLWSATTEEVEEVKEAPLLTCRILKPDNLLFTSLYNQSRSVFRIQLQHSAYEISALMRRAAETA